MGISDDIKPKKTFRLSKEIHKKSAPPEEPEEDYSDDSQEEEVEINSSEPEEKAEPTSPETRSQMEDDFFSGFHRHQTHQKEERVDEKPERKHSCLGKFLTILIVLALAGALIYQNRNAIIDYFHPETDKSTEESLTSEPTDSYVSETPPATATSPTATAEPETTATPATIDKASIVIEVLNGNGIKGSADTVRDSLVTAGFTVSKVANAAKFSYTSTIIYHKTGKEAEAALIKAALPDRSITLELSDTIAKSYDVVVVVGKQ